MVRASGAVRRSVVRDVKDGALCLVSFAGSGLPVCRVVSEGDRP